MSKITMVFDRNIIQKFTIDKRTTDEQTNVFYAVL